MFPYFCYGFAAHSRDGAVRIVSTLRHGLEHRETEAGFLAGGEVSRKSWSPHNQPLSGNYGSSPGVNLLKRGSNHSNQSSFET